MEEVGNEVIINGLRCRLLKHTTKHSLYTLNGMALETYEELVIAKLLVAMNIHFYHHLQIDFPIAPNSSQHALWCPDFIFAQPYRWIGLDCNGSVIIGIEAKKRHIKGKPMQKSRALCEHHGIPILLINGDHLAEYEAKGRLPLKAVA